MGLFLPRNNAISVFEYKQEAGVHLQCIWFNIKWLHGGRLNFHDIFLRGIKIKIKHACTCCGILVWLVLFVYLLLNTAKKT